MKIQLSKKNGGYVLMIVLVLSIIGLTFMAGSMDWASNTSNMTARNNEYFTTSYAAEAATSRTLSALVYDYKYVGEAQVIAHLDQYRTNVPSSADSSYWTNYQFTDGSTNSTTGRMTVGRAATNNTVVLTSPYAGLRSLGSTYQIVADAKNTGSSKNITVGVGQEVNIGIIPIFQFAIFYEDDLEIRPGPNMIVSGLVHGNGDVYFSPGQTLTFSNDVSGSGAMYMHEKPGDQQGNGSGTTVFMGQHLTNVATLNLPVGTGFTNGPHGIIDMPTVGESSTTGVGTNRLYNQADLIIVISNSTVSCKSGIAINNGVTTIPAWTNFLTTNVTFYNVREGSTVRSATLDVGKLKAWSATNASLRPLLGNRDLSSVFIADMRTMNATQQAGICLTNGKTLPSLGLTVVTPDPAYVIGDYNTSSDGVTFYPGTSDTTHTKPAAIMCDAINILSSSFNPRNFTPTNTLTGGARDVTAADTVNAAFLSGIVQTSSQGFSGGVENFPRFLEDWNPNNSTPVTFTYNGSMVEMFSSTVANSTYLQTGPTYNSYNPPTRNWNFDDNYMDSAKQPPLTPSVKTVSAPRWVLLGPNVNTF